MTSPYANLSQSEWREKTQELIDQHPLSLEEIKEIALESWNLLWETKIGTGEVAIMLTEIDIDAPLIGYFFEKLFARELELRYPGEWRGNQRKKEKDLVYIPDDFFSIEVKTSGQLKYEIFNNRSYGQSSKSEGQISKPKKSGYHITVNFHVQTLMLLRFGWIDFTDWKPQVSEKGQSARLYAEVYQHKLIEIPGSYRLELPVLMLKGVGLKAEKELAAEKIFTVQDLLNYKGDKKRFLQFKEQAKKIAKESVDR